jgi:hypothetical protein
VVDLVPLLVMAAFGAGGAGALALIASFSRAETMRRERLWAEVARRLNGRFAPGGGSLLQRRSMVIDAPIEGVNVRIDLHTVHNGKSSTTYTRVAAMAEAPPSLTLRIYEEGFFTTVGKKLGMQDVVVGHAEFDDLFVVKASDEDLARAWLARTVTEPLCRLLSWSHHLQSGFVRATCLGVVEDLGELTRAALAVARFAGRGAALRADWDRVAQDLGGVLTGEIWRDAEPAIALGGSGSPVRIEIAHAALPDGRSPRTSLVTRVCAEGNPPATAGWDEGQRQALEALAPSAVVTTERQVAIAFKGLVFEVERLRSAVAMARQLAGPVSLKQRS